MNARRVSLLVGAVVLAVGTAVYAEDGVKLRYKMAKGDQRFGYSKSETKQTQTIMGQTIETGINIEGYSSRTVDDVDEKGNYHFSERNERIKVKADFGPGGTFDFDSKSSERDKASMLGALLTPIFERMTGATIQVVMTPEGEVKEVKGFSDQFRDLIEANPLAAQFTGGGTDEAAKFSTQDQTPKFGAKTLKVGDTWEESMEMDMPKVGKIKAKKTYRYTGQDKVGDRVTAKIETMSETSVDVNTESMGALVTGSLKTTSATGTIQFDVERGRVIQSEQNQMLAGDLNISVNGMNIPLHQEQTVKVVGKETDKLPD